MPGNTPAEAVNDFLERINKALTCLTPSFLVVKGGYHPSPNPHIATLAPAGDPVDLTVPTGKDGPQMFVAMKFTIIQDTTHRGPWAVHITAYNYALQRPEDREIIAYHWHPDDPPGQRVTWPHVHIGRGAGLDANSFLSHKTHIPTGRVALEEVLRLAVDEFGVQPRSGHQHDWQQVLKQTQDDFQALRTWPSSGI